MEEKCICRHLSKHHTNSGTGCIICKCERLEPSPDEYEEIDDPVNHPSHYTYGKIEVSDFIADKDFNFFRGNAIKYISRAGLKDPSKEIEDLEKAVWYLNREIDRLQKKQ